MSDLHINIRFGTWHLQVTDAWKFSFTFNPYQAEQREADPDWKWFEVYEFFKWR